MYKRQGLGEDLMKGCISYEIVRLMAQGMHPQKACEKAVFELEQKLIKRRGHAGDVYKRQRCLS